MKKRKYFEVFKWGRQEYLEVRDVISGYFRYIRAWRILANKVFFINLFTFCLSWNILSWMFRWSFGSTCMLTARSNSSVSDVISRYITHEPLYLDTNIFRKMVDRLSRLCLKLRKKWRNEEDTSQSGWTTYKNGATWTGTAFTSAELRSLANNRTNGSGHTRHAVSRGLASQVEYCNKCIATSALEQSPFSALQSVEIKYTFI